MPATQRSKLSYLCGGEHSSAVYCCCLDMNLNNTHNKEINNISHYFVPLALGNVTALKERGGGIVFLNLQFFFVQYIFNILFTFQTRPSREV